MLSDLEEVEWTSGEHPEFFLGSLAARPRLFARVIELQQLDPESQELRAELLEGWRVDRNQGLRFQGKLFVPEAGREEVLAEFHKSKFFIHPSGTKMYRALRDQFWWRGMKSKIGRAHV